MSSLFANKMPGVHRMVSQRWPWVVLLLMAALCYYGSYYRHGVNFRDEGGTVALGAQRLLAGEVPIREVALNYNVMWFYPVTWIFKATGVSYVALRVYCFALSALAAVLGFLAVEKARRHSGRTGVPWVAFLVGLMLIAVPGMTFKNYMPLLAVVNTLLVLYGAAVPLRFSQLWRPVVAGGLLVGLTFLIRIDLGVFFTVLWTMMLFARLVERGGGIVSRACVVAGGIVLVWVLAFAAHLPVLWHATARGYRAEFVAQYPNWIGMLTFGLVQWKPEAPKTQRDNVAQPSAPVEKITQEILKRPSFADAKNAKEPWLVYAFVSLAYLPLLTLGALLALACWQWVAGLRRGETARPLAALVLLGGALTVFPQFWFFRPDPPHLSEFMPCFWVGTVGAWFLIGRGTEISRRLLAGLGVVMALHAGLYLARMINDRWTGTIAIRWANKVLFEGDNGVRVYVPSKEIGDLRKLREVIQQHAGPENYVVAYPYLPAVNLLADRRTYERDVYVDNATAGRNWNAKAIGRFEKFKPAVIVFNDWEVNGHADSRFTAWAAPTVQWIKDNYDFAGQFHSWEKFQVYVRRK